jgi:hypothetical protein
MYNSIILSSCLFGSVYIFSKSLEMINHTLLENKKIPRALFLINNVSFALSGAILIYNFNVLNNKRYGGIYG